MNNLMVRLKLMQSGIKYYELDKILGISEPTRCRMLRKELPEEEQERICKLIDEYKSRIVQLIEQKAGEENGSAD